MSRYLRRLDGGPNTNSMSSAVNSTALTIPTSSAPVRRIRLTRISLRTELPERSSSDPLAAPKLGVLW